jgi:hypothetical protein
MPEKIYQCEVKKLFRRGDRNVSEWVPMTVAEALLCGVTDFRCKDCHGAVKLHGRHVAHGPAPHVEHRSRQDSEYCPAGYYFRQHTERKPRLSEHPVD